MEMNYMLAFGSSEASMRLLWRFGLLERLLPVQARSFSLTIRILFSSRSFSEYFGFSCFIQASYFASQGFRRRDERSNMLLVSIDPHFCHKRKRKKKFRCSLFNTICFM